jgi:hypothetical protein
VARPHGRPRCRAVPRARHPRGPVHRVGDLLQSDVGAFRFIAGWGEARFGDGPGAVVFFYLTNLGLPFVLAIVAAFTARSLPNRWFLVAWMVALFVVPNVVVVSAGRVRHEQVLPDHVDRRRDPRRVADPALAAAADRGLC